MQYKIFNIFAVKEAVTAISTADAKYTATQGTKWNGWYMLYMSVLLRPYVYQLKMSEACFTILNNIIDTE